MTQKDNILQELSELDSVLATAELAPVYTVPPGYFEGLAATVLNRIRAMEAATPIEELDHLSAFVGTMSRELPYSVPAGYFEGLEARLLHIVRENNGSLREESIGQTAKEELETLSPLLSGLKKQVPYTVPQGYFENLATGPQQPKTINEAAHKPVTKIISIRRSRWIRYAAAAVVTGMMVLAGFLYFDGEKEPGGKILAKFTRDVKKMDETQKDKLMDFIDNDLYVEDVAQVNTDSKSDEVKTLLQDISDEELKDFQEQTEDIQDILMTD